MKSRIARATLVATLVGVFSGQLMAQGPNPARPATSGQATPVKGTSVALIDLKIVFDNYNELKLTTEGIKRKYDEVDAYVRDQNTTLGKKTEQIKAAPPGSPAFKQLEEDIANMRTQVTLEVNRRRRDLVEEEATVYKNAMQRVEDTVSQFADRYGFDLVLQFRNEEIDPSKPDTLYRVMAQPVIFQRNLNITTYIIDELNRGAAAVPGGISTRPTAPPTNGSRPGTGFPNSNFK